MAGKKPAQQTQRKPVQLNPATGGLLAPFGAKLMQAVQPARQWAGQTLRDTAQFFGKPQNMLGLNVSSRIAGQPTTSKLRLSDAAESGGLTFSNNTNNTTNTPGFDTNIGNFTIVDPIKDTTTSNNTNISSGTYNESTGGQPATTGDGGTSTTTATQTDPYLEALRSAFGGARNTMEGILPTYDTDVDLYKKQVLGGIDTARDTLGETKGNIDKNYGEALRRALQTDREINQRVKGAHSALGTLDSSSYQESAEKQAQALKEQTGNIDIERAKALTGADREFATYERDALGKVDTYTNEIARGKQAIRLAIANADINQAVTLANAIQKMEAEKNNIVNNLNSFKLTAAGLQAQGFDVMGNLRKLNGDQFFNNFGNLLAGNLNNAVSRYSYTPSTISGSGYITAGGMTDEQKRLLGLL